MAIIRYEEEKIEVYLTGFSLLFITYDIKFFENELLWSTESGKNDISVRFEVPRFRGSERKPKQNEIKSNIKQKIT